MWVLDHLDDIESDLSVFHRIEDFTLMDGPRFFRLALRLFAYQGVLAARAMAEQDTTKAESQEVSDTAFAAQFGGIVEKVEV